MLTTATLEHILATIPQRTIGVLGDLFLDRYLDLDAALTEPSIETGLDAYQVSAVRAYPGAAGTVINNLVALGVGRIVPIAMIGDDGEGYELRQALARMPSVDLTNLVMTPERRTPTYTKPMLGRSGEAPRELNRLDIKNRQPLPGLVEAAILERLAATWPALDALLLLDQVSEPECGVVTARVRDHIARATDRIVIVDSRERIGLFRNAWLKPNERECLGAEHDLPAAMQDLARRTNRPVICTRGAKGMLLLASPDAEPIEAPAYAVAGTIDTVGAGDSSSAAMACALVSGADLVQAAAFGNLVASITIQQLGVTGTATPAQVRSAGANCNEEYLMEELLRLNQHLLDSIARADWKTYHELCDPSITCFEPEALGQLVAGMEFHRFYFQLPGATPPFNTTMAAPHVRLMGDVAVISYVRLNQRVGGDGAASTRSVEETRVWQKQNGAWKHVHFHRSATRV